VIASEKAVFGQPEIKLGFFPPYAALRLPELVGVAKAIEIVTTGQNYTAQQSKDLGFVSQVASVEGFQEAVDNTVKQIVMASPLIIRLNKRAVKRHIGTSFSQGVDLVSNYFLKTLMKTEDTLEGISSFEERRKATWKNK
jgi:cyclohexa-1,5-dienecarbonyl-CoA hydratase